MSGLLSELSGTEDSFLSCFGFVGAATATVAGGAERMGAGTLVAGTLTSPPLDDLFDSARKCLPCAHRITSIVPIATPANKIRARGMRYLAASVVFICHVPMP